MKSDDSWRYPLREMPDQLQDFSVARANMVASQLRARGIHDERVLEAMSQIPRHEFVAEEYWPKAYDDHPLPIGNEQTVSQPFIVALMLEALALRGDEVVFEVGTGSGYQTALLAKLAARVFSIERHESLANSARCTLDRLGYTNVTSIVGDGTRGLPEHAPFDAIIVSAAAPGIPKPLFDQMREGGRMVLPVGSAHTQELLLVQKQNGQQLTRTLEGCRFVPLIGDDGFPESR